MSVVGTQPVRWYVAPGASVERPWDVRRDNDRSLVASTSLELDARLIARIHNAASDAHARGDRATYQKLLGLLGEIRRAKFIGKELFQSATDALKSCGLEGPTTNHERAHHERTETRKPDAVGSPG